MLVVGVTAPKLMMAMMMIMMIAAIAATEAAATVAVGEQVCLRRTNCHFAQRPARMYVGRAFFLRDVKTATPDLQRT